MQSHLELHGQTEPQRQYLTFRVDQDLYGVATGQVREILELDQITLVPMMPSVVRGVPAVLIITCSPAICG